MGLSPLTFTGISKYSSDFQTILTRATTIASFPLEQLKNEQNDITQKAQLTQELNSAVKLFQEKIQALAAVADDKGVTATSSNSSKVAVTSVNTDTATTYSITEVSTLATAATETSVNGFADSSSTTVSASGSLRLTVGSAQHTITLAPGENNLVGLRDKINALGAGVTATILTVGPTSNYLSVTANGTGQKALALVEDPSGAATAFLSSTNQGSNLNFKLNGVAVSRSSNQVNDLVPGVSFTVKGTTTGTESVTISLASDRSALAESVKGFAEAYNALQAKISGQVGLAAGLLTGDILVREAQDVLRRASSFGIADGEVRNWSDFGVTFSQTGEAEFDETVFDALSDSGIGDVFRFFESEAGLGDLGEKIGGFTDEINGLAKLAIDQYEKTNQRLNDQIGSMTDRLTVLRASYMQKLQYADALLGSLESQQNVIDASIQSLSLVLFGKREG